MTTSETLEVLRGWFRGRLPEEWFEHLEIVVDREEVNVVGRLPEPKANPGVSETERAAQLAGHIQRFREDTRDQRMAIAREAEQRFHHRISWGAECGGERQMFTNLSVPVMTRLRQPERRVLDTLVEAGVARSRSDALAWCVRLVGKNTDAWLDELRTALEHVERARAAGPQP